jgi:membrane-bound lytic murein transglycosylase A
MRPTLPPAPLPVETKAKKDYDRPLAPGQHALRKITDPARLPDFVPALADRARLAEGIANSRHYLAKKSSQGFFPQAGVTHERVDRSLEAFEDLLAEGLSDEALAVELKRLFDVYESVGCDDRGTVLFTGYYTPIFPGALERTERFRFPLHRAPKNHVKDPITGKTEGLRREDGTVDPAYPTREALTGSPLLEGRELVWLENAFQAYVIGVQGSASLRLPSGELFAVAYAGNNGHPYASIGQALIADGKLRKEDLNLRSLIEYFSAHPEEYESLAARNARYVFFQEGEGGPRGCLNEPVIAMRSIATDKSIFPRASLCFIEAKLPVQAQTFQGFMLDQDAGGAIRAPGRCDVYMGVGDEAGEMAGHTLAEGRLLYLLLKPDALLALH